MLRRAHKAFANRSARAGMLSMAGTLRGPAIVHRAAALRRFDTAQASARSAAQVGVCSRPRQHDNDGDHDAAGQRNQAESPVLLLCPR